MKGQRTWAEWDDDDTWDYPDEPTDPDITGGAVVWLALTLIVMAICAVIGVVAGSVFGWF